MPTKLDLEIAEAGRNELLLQSIDRMVLAGKMRIEAAKDCYDLYSTKCVVDPQTCQVTLENRPLDEALTKIIAERPLWVPQGPDPKVEAQKELESAALAGSVSAHGALFKSMGREGYEAWCKKNSAKPGTPAAGDKTNADDSDRKNPWLAGQWSLQEQGRIVKALGLPAAQRLAQAAGVHVGAVRPVKAA